MITKVSEEGKHLKSMTLGTIAISLASIGLLEVLHRHVRPGIDAFTPFLEHNYAINCGQFDKVKWGDKLMTNLYLNVFNFAGIFIGLVVDS